MIKENKVVIKKKIVVIKFLKVEFAGEWMVSRSNSWTTYTPKSHRDGMEKGKVKIFSKKRPITYLIGRNGYVKIITDVAHIEYDSIVRSLKF